VLGNHGHKTGVAAKIHLRSAGHRLPPGNGRGSGPYRGGRPDRPSSVYNALTSVSANSANDAWAAGSYINDTTGVRDTLILHWNGAAWSVR